VHSRFAMIKGLSLLALPWIDVSPWRGFPGHKPASMSKSAGTGAGDGMRRLITAAMTAACILSVNVSSALSEERLLLTPIQSRAYHDCLFEAWIVDYCHLNSRAYPQCVIANGGGRYALDGHWSSDAYCYYTAQGLLPPRW
jgi:hypothetical protein